MKNINRVAGGFKAKSAGKVFEKIVQSYFDREKITYLHLKTCMMTSCRSCRKKIFVLVPGMSGQPDYLVFMPNGKLVLIELKTGRGTMTDLQLQIRENYAKLGFCYYIVHDNLDEVIRIIGLEKEV